MTDMTDPDDERNPFGRTGLTEVMINMVNKPLRRRRLKRIKTDEMLPEGGDRGDRVFKYKARAVRRGRKIIRRSLKRRTMPVRRLRRIRRIKRQTAFGGSLF